MVKLNQWHEKNAQKTNLVYTNHKEKNTRKICNDRWILAVDLPSDRRSLQPENYVDLCTKQVGCLDVVRRTYTGRPHCGHILLLVNKIQHFNRTGSHSLHKDEQQFTLNFDNPLQSRAPGITVAVIWQQQETTQIVGLTIRYDANPPSDCLDAFFCNYCVCHVTSRS